MKNSLTAKRKRGGFLVPNKVLQAYGICHAPLLYTILSGMTRNYQGRAERHREKKLKAEERKHMNKTDISTILNGIELTDAQVKAILDVNSADITKALNKQKDELASAKDALTKAQETISGLEANKGNLEALQKQIDDYKAADEKRAREAKEAAERAELEERFAAVSGDHKYIHDMVREGVLRDFGLALKDKANRGKGDAEIFDALTKDKGYFANQAPKVDPLGKPGNVGPLKVDDKAAFFKLSFADQTRFKQENETQFKQMFGLQN